jgi:hypothetical protein
MTALTIAALAEAVTPYGIESFDSIITPLWTGIKRHRGKVRIYEKTLMYKNLVFSHLEPCSRGKKLIP